MSYVRWFEEVGIHDVGLVGGKNASLGELIRELAGQDIPVPAGFAIVADAYRHYLDANGLWQKVRSTMDAFAAGHISLAEAGAHVRALIGSGTVPNDLGADITTAYRELSARYGGRDTDVAVRSSATAEDLPSASFAGLHESFLNVEGERALLDAYRSCLASLFTDRAISYRQDFGYDHMKIALSVGVQKMVRSDLGGAGVMFTLDTETGFPNVVEVDAAFGLGENVVQGNVTPDSYLIFKPLLDRSDARPVLQRTLGEKALKMVYGEGPQPTRNVETTSTERTSFVLTDDQLLQLARWARTIESHYGRPMDIEWALDGPAGKLFIVQARPETVESHRTAAILKQYELREKGRALARGTAVGTAIAAGTAFVLQTLDEAGRFRDGGILVTRTTDPDWVPVMRRAAGIVTDHGGRTSHAAIVSRELGVPAIVGTEGGTSSIADGAEITVSCAEGEYGVVYAGRLSFEETELDLSSTPKTQTKIMINLADPEAAFRWWRLPCEGVGLARLEFIINQSIGIHPMALAHLEIIDDEQTLRMIEKLTAGYRDKREFFIDRLARGIAMIAASRFPDPVIVRTSDFKSNEYARLIGGRWFETDEENPMIGFRGASRYYNDRYRDGFALECAAMRRVRNELGFENVIVMIPFCRTLDEADRVLEVMAANGLRRGERGLKVYVMCEIPSNVILATGFAERFDGFSIGSNDLTQLVLGIDRDSAELAPLFDEQNAAVTTMIREVISRAHAAGRPVGLCGQAPSDRPEFAEFLVNAEIDSISLNPDSVLRVREHVAEAEEQRRRAGESRSAGEADD